MFVRHVAWAALPEEFFWRAFVQTSLSRALGSRAAGLFIASVLFGAVHLPGLLARRPLDQALTTAVFVHTLAGLLLGVLWMRTRSLIPGILVHAGFNAICSLPALAPGATGP
jgi:membrane protease YdiL (CAAX protease family)